jgi:hypothetical protein
VAAAHGRPAAATRGSALGRRFDGVAADGPDAARGGGQPLKKGREALEDVADFVTDEIDAAQKKLSKVVRA